MDVVVQFEEMLTVVQNGQVMEVHNAGPHPITFTAAMVGEVLERDKNGNITAFRFVETTTSSYGHPEGKE